MSEFRRQHDCGRTWWDKNPSDRFRSLVASGWSMKSTWENFWSTLSPCIACSVNHLRQEWHVHNESMVSLYYGANQWEMHIYCENHFVLLSGIEGSDWMRLLHLRWIPSPKDSRRRREARGLHDADHGQQESIFVQWKPFRKRLKWSFPAALTAT